MSNINEFDSIKYNRFLSNREYIDFVTFVINENVIIILDFFNVDNHHQKRICNSDLIKFGYLKTFLILNKNKKYVL